MRDRRSVVNLDDEFAPSRQEARCGFSLVEVLVVIAIIGVLLALGLPAISMARQASYDASCRNNLRQMGLALHQYQDVHSRLPAGCSNSGPKEKHRHMSWLTRLLPHLEQEALWQQTLLAYDQKPFFGADPPHVGLATRMPIFNCPMAVGADQIVKFK